MAFEDIVIPQVGEAVNEVTLLEWFKEVGDPVLEGDVLFEVDTDKTVVEIPAFADGILTEIICGDDSLVMPLQVVGKLKTARLSRDRVEEIESTDQSLAPQRPSGSDEEIISRRPVPTKDRPSASPRARRLSRALSVSLSGIAGSGVDGMITESDVRQAASEDREIAGHSEGIREAIARRTAASKSIVPHFYVEMDVDFSRVEQLREGTPPSERPPTITAVIVHACASALTLVPEVNVSYHDGELENRSAVAVAVSVASEHGLINVTLPNLTDVDLAGISERLAVATARARASQLRPADLEPKSLVVSNLGMFGVDAFAAIIDMPDPMILAVGRVLSRPVVEGGVIVIRPMARLTLSVDHRAIDGAGAAMFLGHVRRILEGEPDV